MSYIRRSTPPDIGKGQRVHVKILGYTIQDSRPDSNYDTQRIRFSIYLVDHDYHAYVWMTFYEQPSDVSHLGIFHDTVMSVIDQRFNSITEFLDYLPKYDGYFYAECTDHRERRNKQHPNLKLIIDQVPPRQTQLSSPPSKIETPNDNLQASTPPSKHTINTSHDDARTSTTTSSLTHDQAQIMLQRLRDAGYDV